MRRVLPVLALVAIAVAVLVARGGEDDDYRVAAVFDTARGMVPGQLVKIAGAEVGEIADVELTKDHHARVTFAVDRRFRPFRSDARCRILPEGVISENFVECDPGTPSARPLAATEDGGEPTVALERTEVSVTLQQVVDTFSLPVSERVRIILTELGAAASGRGQDFNAVLRRANPTLGKVRSALGVLRSQRERIKESITATDRVLTQLSADDDDVRRFVARTADVTRTTDARRDDIARSIRSLPPMLDELDRTLPAFDRAAVDLGPTAKNLRAAAPGLRRVNDAIPTFADAIVPAAKALEKTSAVGIEAVPPLRPMVRQLDGVTANLAEPFKLANDFLVDFRDTGGIEELMWFAYALGIEGTMYDSVSHMLTMVLSVPVQCFASSLTPSVPPARGCNHNYDAENSGKVPFNELPIGGRSRAGAPKVSAKSLSPSDRRNLLKVVDGLLKGVKR